MYITSRTNSSMLRSRSAKNGEVFIGSEEVIKEIENYGDFLKGKKVYIPNTKLTTELSQCDAFGRYFSLSSTIKKYEIKEVSYSYYDENGMFVLFTISNDSLTRTNVDASFDDSRLFNVFKQIDKCDVVICNPEGSKADDLFRHIYLSKKDFLLSVNKTFVGTKIGYTAFINGDIKFGYNLPKKYFNVDKNKNESRGDMMWITNFDNKYTPKYVSTFYDMNCHKYDRFENYDAINVECIKMIPMDYNGVMGIPVTFAPQLNLNQFEVLGLAAGNSKASGFYGDVPYVPHPEDRGGCAIVNGVRVFTRLLVRFRNI